MVTIVSGAINEGKTRKIISLYENSKQGDGVVSKKIFRTNLGSEEIIYPAIKFCGYDIMHLSTGKTMPLAYKHPFVPEQWDELYRCGPYLFSRSAFEFAWNILGHLIENGTSPLFIDEIGPLELEGKGFAPVLRRALESAIDVTFTTRKHCLEDVVKTFNINDFQIVGMEITTGPSQPLATHTQKTLKKMGGKIEPILRVFSQPA